MKNNNKEIPYSGKVRNGFAMLALVLAVGYLCASIYVFFKDMAQIVAIILQFGIWVTPIMWDMDTMDINAVFKNLLKLNPLYYVVQGYRDALIGKTAFWERPGHLLYFWIFTVLCFGLGAYVFKKLRMHFADVL